MTQTITLGTGPDAIEVEDWASVPLIGGGCGTLAVLGGGRVVCFHPEGTSQVELCQGHFMPLPAGHCTGLDLAALRRERAPKVEAVGGWTNGVFQGPTIHNLYASTVLNLFQRADAKLGATYWTHRPGNTPEKQAAFDAAMNGWCAAVEAHTAKMGSVDDAPWRLYEAARALGYGSKR